MNQNLSNSAKRVQDYLNEKGFTFDVKEMPDSSRTAQEAADAIGCTLGQIAKSLIFKNKETGELVLIIASGSNRVDVSKIEQAENIRLSQANAKQVREITGYAIGGIPRVAHNETLKTYKDQDPKQ